MLQHWRQAFDHHYIDNMTPEEFTNEFYLLKKSLIENAFNTNYGSDVSTKIAGLNLDNSAKEKFKDIISSLLTDAFYTILLGLDGEAQIGIRQETYKIFDEQDNELTGGEIEGYAYEYFHNKR